MSYLPLNYARIAALAALLAACTDRTETGDSTSGTDASTGADATGTDTTPTTGDTGGQPAGPFGFVCVRLNTGESVAGDPFAGTRKITVTLDYEPCLVDYYIAKHPEMRQDGADGAQVFTDWQSRLCSEDVPGRAECEVESIVQTLEQGMESSGSAVTYTIAAGAELNGQKLLWGPAPLPEFAECEDGLQPFVKLDSLSGVVGFDENDVALWQLQSFGDARALIGLSGMACIDANVAPTSP